MTCIIVSWWSTIVNMLGGGGVVGLLAGSGSGNCQRPQDATLITKFKSWYNIFVMHVAISFAPPCSPAQSLPDTRGLPLLTGRCLTTSSIDSMSASHRVGTRIKTCDNIKHVLFDRDAKMRERLLKQSWLSFMTTINQNERDHRVRNNSIKTQTISFRL